MVGGKIEIIRRRRVFRRPQRRFLIGVKQQPDALLLGEVLLGRDCPGHPNIGVGDEPAFERAADCLVFCETHQLRDALGSRKDGVNRLKNGLPFGEFMKADTSPDQMSFMRGSVADQCDFHRLRTGWICGNLGCVPGHDQVVPTFQPGACQARGIAGECAPHFEIRIFGELRVQLAVDMRRGC